MLRIPKLPAGHILMSLKTAFENILKGSVKTIVRENVPESNDAAPVLQEMVDEDARLFSVQLLHSLLQL